MDRKSVYKNLIKLYGCDVYYTLVQKYNKDLAEKTKIIKKKLKKQLLPKLKLFKDFKILFGNLPNKSLGLYINGSSSWKPTILLSLQNIKQSAEQYILDYELVIETTILHELGHAIQDRLGLSYDEEEAENFAKMYYDNNYIIKIGE